MERLTKRENGEICVIERNNSFETDAAGAILNALNKLADYEDAEENGLLVKLSCKVGDDIWSSEPFKDDKMRHGNITVVMIDENGFYGFWCTFDNEPISAEFIADDIGKTVFLTPEKAKQELKGERR